MYICSYNDFSVLIPKKIILYENSVQPRRRGLKCTFIIFIYKIFPEEPIVTVISKCITIDKNIESIAMAVLGRNIH